MSRYRRTLPMQTVALLFLQDLEGHGEVGGNNRGPTVEYCLRAASLDPGAAWCAAAVNAAAEYASAIKNQRSPLEGVALQGLVQSYVGWAREVGRVAGRDPATAGVGDIVCFSTGRTGREFDHMGMVRPGGPDVPDGHYATIEANTSPGETADAARQRDGEVIANRKRSAGWCDPLFIAWARDP